MFTPLAVTIDSRNGISSQANGTTNVPSLGIQYLGPNALSVFISAIETGVIIVLFARFFVRKRERLTIQLLVYFVTFVALFQMGATFATWWRISVEDVGNWAAVSDLQWPDKIHFTLSSFIAAPVQLFYIWRCWHVSLNRRPYIAFILVLLVIGSVGTEVFVMVLMCLVDWHSVPVHLLGVHAYYTCSMLSVAFSVGKVLLIAMKMNLSDDQTMGCLVTDFAVTGILLVFLIRSRSDVHTRQFRHTLFRLIHITWETAVPPFTCAIATLIAGALSAPVISSWGLMLQTVLGKLYLISLFVTLEGRAILAGVTDRTHFPTLTGASRNMLSAWSVRPGKSNHTDASKPPDLPLEFKVVSSDLGAEGSSTFNPETTKPESV
ncbi:hypothetical protein BGY98DRAFT_1190320 [Russula aff. rugulosa BPL654]|nr:hypothetical protein BGY98DRAFT_1190320 [Russula aff. rugulosa BPL654]